MTNNSIKSESRLIESKHRKNTCTFGLLVYNLKPTVGTIFIWAALHIDLKIGAIAVILLKVNKYLYVTYMCNKVPFCPFQPTWSDTDCNRLLCWNASGATSDCHLREHSVKRSNKCKLLFCQLSIINVNCLLKILFCETI